MKWWNHYQRCAALTIVLYGSDAEVLRLDFANPDYDTVCARFIHLTSQTGDLDYAKMKTRLLETVPLAVHAYNPDDWEKH